MNQPTSIFTYNTACGGTSESDLEAILAIYYNMLITVLQYIAKTSTTQQYWSGSGNIIVVPMSADRVKLYKQNPFFDKALQKDTFAVKCVCCEGCWGLSRTSCAKCVVLFYI
jgi:hypothetical protein